MVTWEEFHATTGLPRGAYDEFIKHDAKTQQDILEIYQNNEVEIIKQLKKADGN